MGYRAQSQESNQKCNTGQRTVAIDRFVFRVQTKTGIGSMEQADLQRNVRSEICKRNQILRRSARQTELFIPCRQSRQENLSALFLSGRNNLSQKYSRGSSAGSRLRRHTRHRQRLSQILSNVQIPCDIIVTPAY